MPNFMAQQLSSAETCYDALAAEILGDEHASSTATTTHAYCSRSAFARVCFKLNAPNAQAPELQNPEHWAYTMCPAQYEQARRLVIARLPRKCPQLGSL